MAVISRQVSAIDTQETVLLDGNDYDGVQGGVLKNVTGTAPVYLGPPGVTSATGFRWDPADGPMSHIDLKPDEVLSCRLAAGAAAQTIHVLAASE